MADFINKNTLPKIGNSNPKFIPVILSGGKGSRLWPVSREGHPKPFMKLADGQSLLEKTYQRAANLLFELCKNYEGEVLTVTNRDYYFNSRDEFDRINCPGTFLLEPCSKNTGPAIALAAHLINEKFGADTTMLVLAADHLISDDAAFARAVKDAVQLANAPHNLLVTFGVIPTRPETGFGYIEAGEKIEVGQKVRAFIEKPDARTAQKYIDDGYYLWNSGMFCFSAGQFLKQLNVHAPELALMAQNCWQAITREYQSNLSAVEIPEEYFSALPDISVDYAVMEKSDEVAVIASDFGWNDVGSWLAIRDLIPANVDGNRANSDAIFLDSSNTYVQSNDRLVAAVGVSNLMIVDTKDALLVINPDATQEVKKVVDLLKEKNHDSIRYHKKVVRPWGTYTVLEEGEGFKIKKIAVNPGASLSLQSHKYRSEHWVVVKGRALIVNGETTATISANQSTFIPAGHKHRLENPTIDMLIMIEVQCGEYLGEDDIVRFEDIYGRK
jgi:mannose-1-phosphate guanylyltransferase / mannose-6-phosphate isomerase